MSTVSEMVQQLQELQALLEATEDKYAVVASELIRTTDKLTELGAKLTALVARYEHLKMWAEAALGAAEHPSEVTMYRNKNVVDCLKKGLGEP